MQMKKANAEGSKVHICTCSSYQGVFVNPGVRQGMLLKIKIAGPQVSGKQFDIRIVCLVFFLSPGSHCCCHAEIYLEGNQLWEFGTQTSEMAHLDSIQYFFILIASHDHHSSHLRPTGTLCSFPISQVRKQGTKQLNKLPSFVDAEGLYPVHVAQQAHSTGMWYRFMCHPL